MEMKKISFGFSKVVKQSTVPPKRPANVELITSIEDQAIKPVEEIKVQKTELIIPLKNNSTTSSALQQRLNEIKSRCSKAGEKKLKTEIHQNENTVPTDPLGDNISLEQKAIQELMQNTEDIGNVETDETLVDIVPLKPDELPLEGASESTLDDYEKIPISQFGVAMLRGMGWSGELKKPDVDDIGGPAIRPKGMGLGADKMIKPKPLLVAPLSNDIMEIKKRAYVRCLAGKYKDAYAQVIGLDDYAGRVIVKLALGGTHQSFNEFLLQPVSKAEFEKYGKVINAAKYDEYQKNNSNTQKSLIDTKREHDYNDVDVKREKYSSSRSNEIKREKKSTDRRRSRSRSKEKSRRIKEEKISPDSSYRYSDKRKSRSHSNDRSRQIKQERDSPQTKFNKKCTERRRSRSRSNQKEKKYRDEEEYYNSSKKHDRNKDYDRQGSSSHNKKKYRRSRSPEYSRHKNQSRH